MATDPEIIERLDRIRATLVAAFAVQIGEFSQKIGDDKVDAA